MLEFKVQHLHKPTTHQSLPNALDKISGPNDDIDGSVIGFKLALLLLLLIIGMLWCVCVCVCACVCVEYWIQDPNGEGEANKLPHGEFWLRGNAHKIRIAIMWYQYY